MHSTIVSRAQILYLQMSNPRNNNGKRKKRARTHDKQHALVRKYVRLQELKLVGMLQENDEVEFSYKNAVFVAKLTKDGLLAVSDDPVHRMACGVRGSLAVYDKPSNWTNDCVAKYLRDNRITTPCKTNPSGFERVVVRRLSKSLNTLRNEYMAQNSIGTNTHVLRPEEIAVIAQRRSNSDTSSKRFRTESYDEIESTAETMAMIDHDPCTVATLHAQGEVRGYKNIALELEQKLQLTKRALAAQERIIAHLVSAETPANQNARQDGERLLGLTAKYSERLERERSIVEYANERIRSIDKGNSLLPPQFEITDILAEVFAQNK